MNFHTNIIMQDVNEVKQEVAPAIQERRGIGKLMHMVLAVAYVGQNYNGSQMQNGKNALVSTTIEGELVKVLLKLGMCRDNDFKNLDLERASRTDSHVSAAMALFTVWVPNNPSLEEQVNAELPNDIRVIGVQRTTPRFNVRMMCTSRRYEYLAPVRAFLPLPMYNSKRQIYEQFLSDNTAQINITAKPELFAMREIRFPASAELGQFDELLLEPLNMLCKTSFCTRTNSFMNFTTEAKVAQVSETNRKYDQFEFGPAFVQDNEVYSLIKICGPSFMYNQIRKMVAAVALVARGQCPPAWLGRALSGRQEFKTEIPTAPGELLLLCRQEFKGHAGSVEAQLYGPLLSENESIIQKSEEFKKLIYTSAYQMSPTATDQFVHTLDECDNNFDGYELAKDALRREVEISQIIQRNKTSIEVNMK